MPLSLEKKEQNILLYLIQVSILLNRGTFFNHFINKIVIHCTCNLDIDVVLFVFILPNFAYKTHGKHSFLFVKNYLF